MRTLAAAALAVAMLAGADATMLATFDDWHAPTPASLRPATLVVDSLPPEVRAGWAPAPDDAATLALAWARPGDLVITFGVGEPWKIAQAIVAGLPQ